jgi:hypothetical protein
MWPDIGGGGVYAGGAGGMEEFHRWTLVGRAVTNDKKINI